MSNGFSTRRRELLKPSMQNKYAKALLMRGNGFLEWLYGGNLSESAQKCELAQKVAEVWKRKNSQHQQGHQGQRQQKQQRRGQQETVDTPHQLDRVPTRGEGFCLSSLLPAGISATDALAVPGTVPTAVSVPNAPRGLRLQLQGQRAEPSAAIQPEAGFCQERRQKPVQVSLPQLCSVEQFRAGNRASRVEIWLKVTKDPWVIAMEEGVVIPLLSWPLHGGPPFPYRLSGDERVAVDKESG